MSYHVARGSTFVLLTTLFVIIGQFADSSRWIDFLAEREREREMRRSVDDEFYHGVKIVIAIHFCWFLVKLLIESIGDIVSRIGTENENRLSHFGKLRSQTRTDQTDAAKRLIDSEKRSSENTCTLSFPLRLFLRQRSIWDLFDRQGHEDLRQLHEERQPLSTTFASRKQENLLWFFDSLMSVGDMCGSHTVD